MNGRDSEQTRLAAHEDIVRAPHVQNRVGGEEQRQPLLRTEAHVREHPWAQPPLLVTQLEEDWQGPPLARHRGPEAAHLAPERRLGKGVEASHARLARVDLGQCAEVVHRLLAATLDRA